MHQTKQQYSTVQDTVFNIFIEHENQSYPNCASKISSRTCNFWMEVYLVEWKPIINFAFTWFSLQILHHQPNKAHTEGYYFLYPYLHVIHGRQLEFCWTRDIGYGIQNMVFGWGRRTKIVHARTNISQLGSPSSCKMRAESKNDNILDNGSVVNLDIG